MKLKILLFYFSAHMLEPRGLRSIRTDLVSDSYVSQIFSTLYHPLDTNQIALTMNIVWQIWKARCAKLFSNTVLSPDNTLQGVWALSDLTHYTSFVR